MSRRRRRKNLKVYSLRAGGLHQKLFQTVGSEDGSVHEVTTILTGDLMLFEEVEVRASERLNDEMRMIDVALKT